MKRIGCVLAGLLMMLMAAAPAMAQSETANDLRIEQAVICLGVEDRNPVQAGEVFSSDSGTLFCYTRVLGAGGETSITHNWYYQGALKASIQLPVRSANWRTWSRKSVLPEWTGEWMVEVLDVNGVPLESLVFQVQ